MAGMFDDLIPAQSANSKINSLFPQGDPVSPDFTTAMRTPVTADQPTQNAQPVNIDFSDLIPQKNAQSSDFMQRMADDYTRRVGNDQVSRDAFVNGKQSGASTALQMFGQGAGLVGDAAANAVGSGLRGLYDISVGDAKPIVNQQFQDAGDYLKNSALGRFVGDQARSAANDVGSLSTQYPVTMRDLGALGNIAQVVPVLDGAGGALNATGKVLSKVGAGVADSGDLAAQAARNKEIFKVITPKETPAVAKDLGTRSTLQGINNTVTPQPNAFENKVIDTVSNLQDAKGNPLIKASDPHVLTYNKLDNAVTDEAQKLKANLAYADAANPAQAEIPKTDIMAQYKTALSPIINDPLLGKSGKTRVGEALAKIDSMIPASGNTASDLLDIRKQFDQAIEKFKGESALNPVRANAFTEAGKAIRQTTNDIVAAKYPQAAVRDSLDKQFHIYNAMDAVESKIPAQAKTRIGRAYQNFPGKNPYIKTGLATAGLTATGAAPAAVASGLALYGAKKAVTSPLTRQIIGGTLRGTGNALKNF